MTQRRQWRVFNRRRLIAAQAVLALVAVTALVLSGAVIVRSIHTSMLNRSLIAMHTVDNASPEVEIAAPPIGDDFAGIEGKMQTQTASPLNRLVPMTMPDGSPIVNAVESRFDDQGNAASTGGFHRTDLGILPDMLELTQRNPDTVGWLGISGVVYQPVVYRDNRFYLDHDFTGVKNSSGALFLDESSPLNPDTQNLLIHGHSMNDGSMFGILTHYRRLEFLKRHPLISFSTLWEKETYAVFAVLQVSSKAEDATYFNYFDHATFTTEEEFYSYIRELQAHSIFEIPVDAKPSDALLTLSTCIGEKRLVILSRRMRPEETKEELISAVETSC